MIDRSSDGSGPDLPPELEELHRELSSIHIEERASFGPELRAELESARSDGVDEERGARAGRVVLAAALGALLLAGIAVPTARAALGDFVGSVRGEVETIFGTPSEPELPEVVMDRPLLSLDDERPSADADARPGSRPAGPPRVAGTGDVRLDVTSFPEIMNRERARTIIEEFYPDSLQARRIGGRVGLLIRVSSTGEVDEVRLRRSSGLGDLDRAALDGVRALDFRPAVRAGDPVDTWVQFDVDFQPPPPEEETAVPAPQPRF